MLPEGPGTVNRINPAPNQGRIPAFMRTPAVRRMTAAFLASILGMACPELFCLPVSASPRSAEPGLNSSAEVDAFLRGYIQAWLLQTYRLGPERVRIEVRQGAVTLSGSADTSEQIEAIVAAVSSFAQVTAVHSSLVASGPGKPPQDAGAGGPQQGGQRWSTWLRWLLPPPGRKSVPFPAGDLFTAPLADPKQPRFHTTYQHWKTGNGNFDVAAVGFGEDFGLVRLPREREGDGWQFGISGAVFAVFNLDTSSKDLLNADYIVGFPIAYRSGAWSARLRPYHQSSHLGDEFLLQPGDNQPVPPVERINLSYEAVELLVSREQGDVRVYGGATRIFSSSTPLRRRRVQVGVEYRGNPRGWRTARIVAGLDVEAWDETGWDRDYSAKAGVRFRSPYGEARSVQLLVEYFHGHAPYGQFYKINVEYLALGIAYAF
jgi:hypothetical protein